MTDSVSSFDTKTQSGLLAGVAEGVVVGVADGLVAEVADGVVSEVAEGVGVGVAEGVAVGDGVGSVQSRSPKQLAPKTSVQPPSQAPSTTAAQLDGHWQQSLAPAVLVAVGLLVGSAVGVGGPGAVRTFTARICVTNAKVAAVWWS